MPELDIPEESAPPLDWGVAMDEKAAKAYHGTLSTEEKQIPTGCYCVRCVSCGGCPVGASLNINCGTCIYPVLSTFIFSACMCMPRVSSDGSYTNLKNTASIYVVDKSPENFAFATFEGMHCCYCTRVC